MGSTGAPGPLVETGSTCPEEGSRAFSASPSRRLQALLGALGWAGSAAIRPQRGPTDSRCACAIWTLGASGSGTPHNRSGRTGGGSPELGSERGSDLPKDTQHVGSFIGTTSTHTHRCAQAPAAPASAKTVYEAQERPRVGRAQLQVSAPEQALLPGNSQDDNTPFSQ